MAGAPHQDPDLNSVTPETLYLTAIVPRLRGGWRILATPQRLLQRTEGPEYHKERSGTPTWHVNGFLVPVFQKGIVGQSREEIVC